MTRRRTRRTPRPRGAALLMAMMTVTLVATLAAAALWRQWRGIEVESAERTRVQSAWLLTGALDWARVLLQGDLREDMLHPPPVDHLGEPWAVPLAESRLSDFLSAGDSGASDLERNAFLSGQVTDLQSRLNVLDLAASGQQTQADALARFTRLFQALGLSASPLAALQRNLICAYTAMYPGQSGSACNVSDAPILPQRVEQLTWLGLDAATVARLSPYVTVLPLLGPGSITPVNLNTASSVVIYAALPGLETAQAECMTAQRQTGYFKSVQDAAKCANGMDLTGSPWIAVNTSFFEVRGRLRLDDAALQEVSVVQRNANTPATRMGVFPLWRARSALTQPAPGGP